MLSAVASMTPYSDFNQSPRNMYQCQVSLNENKIMCLAENLNFSDICPSQSSSFIQQSRFSSRFYNAPSYALKGCGNVLSLLESHFSSYTYTYLHIGLMGICNYRLTPRSNFSTPPIIWNNQSINQSINVYSNIKQHIYIKYNKKERQRK